VLLLALTPALQPLPQLAVTLIADLILVLTLTTEVLLQRHGARTS
jgi:hypothetical protein